MFSVITYRYQPVLGIRAAFQLHLVDHARGCSPYQETNVDGNHLQYGRCRGVLSKNRNWASIANLPPCWPFHAPTLQPWN